MRREESLWEGIEMVSINQTLLSRQTNAKAFDWYHGWIEGCTLALDQGYQLIRE